MESTNPMLSEGVAGAEISWRTQMTDEFRQRTVTKIFGLLMKNVSNGPQEAPRFKIWASNFEQKIFSTANSKAEYWGNIHSKMQIFTSRYRQSLPRSSLPGPAYSVESSIHQVSPLHQYHGHKRQLEMQNHPQSVAKDQLRQAGPAAAIHHQGTSQPNQTKQTVQQQQRPNDINGQLDGQQKVVLDLLSQHRLRGTNSQSGRNMHQSGRQVNASTFNEEPRSTVIQNDQSNIARVTKPEVQPQSPQIQPLLLQTFGLQQPNLQLMSQVHLQPHDNNMQVMAEGTSQAIHSMGDDWKEQLYNKIKSLKNLFLPVLKEKYQKIAKMLQKMESIPQQQRTSDYERMQMGLAKTKKACLFLHFPKDKMSENLLIQLPEFEKSLYNLIEDRSGELTFSSQQKQLPASDGEQSLRQPIQLQSQIKQQRVTAEREDIHLQKRPRTENLAQHTEQRGLQHLQQSVNLLARHNSQFNQAINEKQVQSKRAITGKFLQNNSKGDYLLSIQQPVKSLTNIDMNNLVNSSQNISHCSPYPVSVDPPIFPAQVLMNEDQSIRRCANTGTNPPQPTRGMQAASTLPSSLLSDIADYSSKQINNSGTGLSGSSVPEEPIQRLIKAARAMSHNAFDACVGDMELVLRMVDMTAGQVAGNGSEFVVGEDLAAASTCGFGLKRDVSSQTMQRDLYTTSIPVRFSESGILSDGINHLIDPEASQLESSITTHDNKSRFKVNCNLLEEIREINMQLIETVVEFIQHGFRSESGEGTVVKCSYTPVAISSKMKSELAAFPVSPIMPLELIVPVNYPAHSPEILDKLPSEISMGCEDLSTKAKSKLMLNIKTLHQPISLTDIVRTWDACVRAVISDFVQNLGGGSFSSTYGTWKELCKQKAYCSRA